MGLGVQRSNCKKSGSICVIGPSFLKVKIPAGWQAPPRLDRWGGVSLAGATPADFHFSGLRRLGQSTLVVDFCLELKPYLGR